MAGGRTRPFHRARMIARLTGETMRRYCIEVKNWHGLYKRFWSYSRNARKHLRDNIPISEIGARCVVYTHEAGRVVSACTYDEKGAIRYISW